MEKIDLKSQQISNISAFLKWRDRPPGILAGVYHNGQPSKETFVLGGKQQCSVTLDSSI